MERFDHVAKFVHRAEWILTRAIGLMRRKKRDWRIAPIIDLFPAGILGIELKHRQQFDGGNAEFLQIWESFRSVRHRFPAFRLATSGARMAGEPPHVHFVDDGARGRTLQRRVSFPLIGAWIHHDAFHRASQCCRLADWQPRGCSAPALRRHGHRDRAALWWDQNAGHAPDRTDRARDIRRFARAEHRTERCASSDRCGWHGSRDDDVGRLGIIRRVEEAGTRSLWHHGSRR